MNNTAPDSKASMSPRYRAYKDSGIAWLGEIPAHWKVKKVTRLFKTIGSGTTPPSGEDHWYNGSTHWVTTSELRETIIYNTKKKVSNATLNKFTTLKVYPPGTTLIAMYGATIGRLGILGVKACTNQACCALSEPINTDGKFIYYWLWGNKAHIINLSSGGGQPNINQDKVSELRVSIPPLLEQQAIAAYLDDKTAKLDTLIANKREQVAQLETLRKFTIQHAVTRGLNPDAPMKDSGINWLGEIPVHWEVKRLKTFLNDIEQGWSPQCENRPAEENEWAVLKVGCVNGGVFSKQENKALPESESPKKEYLINKGDVLASRANTRELLGSCCLVDNEYPRLILCDKLYRLDIQTLKLNKQFFIHFMQTRMARYQIESKATGASDSMQNIAQSVLEEMLMAIPAEHEQQAIAAYLDDKTARLDTLIANQREQIQQLETLRKVTIHDAVTGQINVSGLEV